MFKSFLCFSLFLFASLMPPQDANAAGGKLRLQFRTSNGINDVVKRSRLGPEAPNYDFSVRARIKGSRRALAKIAWVEYDLDMARNYQIVGGLTSQRPGTADYRSGFGLPFVVGFNGNHLRAFVADGGKISNPPRMSAILHMKDGSIQRLEAGLAVEPHKIWRQDRVLAKGEIVADPLMRQVVDAFRRSHPQRVAELKKNDEGVVARSRQARQGRREHTTPLSIVTAWAP